ncbi:MAG: DUF1007 family protein [Desulfobacteraceae bacterium]|jgi:ABC-type uncharacterized transport system substrate-binding protein
MEISNKNSGYLFKQSGRFYAFIKKPGAWIPVLSILIFIGIAVSVLGHAHVWIDGAVIIKFDDQGMSGFRQEWVLDEMFSNMLIHDYDKNLNKKFEPKEVKDIYENAFINLENFDYFTHVKVDGKTFTIDRVKDFKAKIIDGSVVYHFFILCPVEAGKKYKEVKIAVYDESFYTNITILKDHIFFENDSDYDCRYEIKKNKDDAFYYGQMYPEEIVLRFRKKNE